MNPCLLIPIYDHKDEIRGVLDGLAEFGLPCLVVDDGSDSETRAVLDAAEKDCPWVEVYHRDRNGGRGAALTTGYRFALDRGFSHAIQLDADGQHDASDVPQFIEAIREDPEALVLGTPVFDETVPKGRLYGRQLSRAMVWAATLSFDVSDPLCGFRGVPLAATVELLDETDLGDHMEFDPNLVIRLHWAGVPVRNVPTRVVYNEGGLSHFDMVADNVRMSGVYSRALLGMLVRSPGWLLGKIRPQTDPRPTDWMRMAERGTAGALRFGAWFHETFGRRPMQGMLWGIAIYFYLFHRAVGRGSRQYLDRIWASPSGRESLGRPPGRLMVLRHIHSFAVGIYDRLVVWGGALDSYHVDHDGSEKIFELAEQGRGALLLGAHLGSYEMLWFLSREYDLAVNVVVYYQNAERVNQFFDSISPDVHIRAISLDPHSVNAAFQIKACIDRGEFVVILADRVAPGPGVRAADASFLGKTARFPMGPFLLAGTLGCPVLMAMCVRTGTARYQTVLRPLRDAGRIRRDERENRAQELMGQYISILETYCEQYPLEWFNFFEFWGAEP